MYIRYTGPNPWTDKAWLYQEYVVHNKTSRQIAEEWGCAPTTITTMVSRFGLKKLPPKYTDKEWLTEQYCNQQRSTEDIGNELGCSNDTISRWLSRFGLARRGKSHPLKLNISKEQLEEEYVLNRKSISQIAKEYNTPRHRISRLIEEMGIDKYDLATIQMHVRDKEYPNELTDESWLQEQYIFQRKSRKDIALELGVDPETVYRALIRFKIPIRGVSEAQQGLQSGPNHPRWTGLADVKALVRQYFTDYQVKPTLARDYYRCSLCESQKDLHVHHIIPIQTIIDSVLSMNPHLDLDNPDDRHKLSVLVINNNTFQDFENLATVCKECHYNVIHTRDNQQPSSGNREGSTTIESAGQK